MKIISSNTNLYNNSKQVQTCSATSFKSVVPVKVFVDGEQTNSLPLIKRALKILTSTLFNKPARDDENAKYAKDLFSYYVNDYQLTKGIGDKSKYYRTEITADGKIYLLNGSHASQLDELGKHIGLTKKNIKIDKEADAEALEHNSFNLFQMESVRPFSFDEFKLKKLREEYSKKISSILFSMPEIKVRRFINPNTGEYEGDKVNLCVHVQSNGKLGKKGGKIDFDKITFI